MVAISVERFLIVHKPVILRNVKLNKRLYIIAACVALGLAWSSLPLIGWSHYSLEAAKTSCSVEWAERSLAVTSYNVTIFVFVFFVPLAVILVFNCMLIVFIKKFYRKKMMMLKATKYASPCQNVAVPSKQLVKSDDEVVKTKTCKITLVLIIYICK